MSSLSLQTFTNFIPLSWSSSQQPSAAPAISFLSHGPSNSTGEATLIPDAASSRKCGYITRKKQLQSLKAQMDIEGVGTMRTPVQCKKCDGDLVFIWDNQEIFTLLIIYSPLQVVALWTCFVHILYGPIPSNMRRAFFYAKYALPPFLIYFVLDVFIRSTPRRTLFFIPLSVYLHI
jgi:hypothetical protein